MTAHSASCRHGKDKLSEAANPATVGQGKTESSGNFHHKRHTLKTI
jgi:hypothetical protein